MGLSKSIRSVVPQACIPTEYRAADDGLEAVIQGVLHLINLDFDKEDNNMLVFRNNFQEADHSMARQYEELVRRLPTKEEILAKAEERCQDILETIHHKTEIALDFNDRTRSVDAVWMDIPPLGKCFDEFVEFLDWCKSSGGSPEMLEMTAKVVLWSTDGDFMMICPDSATVLTKLKRLAFGFIFGGYDVGVARKEASEAMRVKVIGMEKEANKAAKQPKKRSKKGATSGSTTGATIGGIGATTGTSIGASNRVVEGVNVKAGEGLRESEYYARLSKDTERLEECVFLAWALSNDTKASRGGDGIGAATAERLAINHHEDLGELVDYVAEKIKVGTGKARGLVKIKNAVWLGLVTSLTFVGAIEDSIGGASKAVKLMYEKAGFYTGSLSASISSLR